MTNAIQNAVAKNGGTAVSAAGNPQKTMRDLINRMSGEIAKALPSVMTPERFTRITLSALSNNPTLAECTPSSFMGAMMTAAQLGVEPNTPLGQAYLIPYKNNKKITDPDGKTRWIQQLECQFQLGYKGMLDLAYRSGEISVIQAHTVHENDTFEVEFGLDAKLTHKPKMDGDRGKAIAYYAMFRTKDGGYGFEVMSVDDINEHARKFSKSFGNGPWQTNFDEMAKKTVLKKVLKYAPLKSDFVRGISQDETIKTEISDDMSMVPSVLEVEGEVVDSETGEIIDGEKKE